MYLEIEKQGSLNQALNKEFESMGSPLRVLVDLNLKSWAGLNLKSWSGIKHENKYSQVSVASEEKWYIPDFWRNGVCLAIGETSNFKELVSVLNYWLLEDVTTKELVSNYNFVSAHEKAEAFDEKRELEYTWNRYLHDEYDIRDFLVEAINDEIVGKLFPYRSLTSLCFSRCTGFPYTTDTPSINPSPKNKSVFEVWANRTEKIGEGNALEALNILKQHLPPNIQPAISGTKDDLKD